MKRPDPGEVAEYLASLYSSVSYVKRPDPGEVAEYLVRHPSFAMMMSITKRRGLETGAKICTRPRSDVKRFGPYALGSPCQGDECGIRIGGMCPGKLIGDIHTHPARSASQYTMPGTRPSAVDVKSAWKAKLTVACIAQPAVKHEEVLIRCWNWKPHNPPTKPGKGGDTQGENLFFYDHICGNALANDPLPKAYEKCQRAWEAYKGSFIENEVTKIVSI